VVLVACAALVPASLLSCKPRAADGANSAKTGDKGARVAVAALGRLAPGSRLLRIAGPPGERIQRLEVDELAEVKKGQVLAILESHDERLARVRRARLTLEQLVATNPPRLAAMQAEVKRREGFREERRSELARYEPLLAKKVLAEDLVVRQRHVVEQAESSLAAGRADLANLQAEIATNVGVARADLAVAESLLERTVIKAPVDGFVLHIAARPGEAIGDGAILTMGDTRQMIALVEVYESDLQYLRLGQKATLKSPALPKELTGSVRRIGRVVARNQVYDLGPAADQDARVVEVEVALDDSAAAARFVSLQVDVVIQTS